uniref:MAT2-4 n=1 Tax=Aspergillus pseudoglaucus TaxID=1405805 RepID=A0A3G6VE17_ASPPE|nr:MAT2-4 [Aspergillus pseudoglaucus]
MDYERDVLLWYLGTVADAAKYNPELRNRATNIIASFMKKRNAYRKKADATTLARGELVMYPFQQVANIPRNKGLPVRRFPQNINAITCAFGIIPCNDDYEGHPIELISILDPAIENSMNDNQHNEFHRALLVNEKQANADFARSVQRYGYHYIFGAGLQQYYMTKTVNEMKNFNTPDPRGNAYRVRVQKVCYAAIERRLRLKKLEKTLLIRTTRSFPADNFRFTPWISNLLSGKRCLNRGLE